MALFELKQDYGNEAEGLPPPPTFKDCAAADIDTVFFNGNEHADRHIIDGKDVLVVIVEGGTREHNSHWEAGAKQNFDTGLYKAHTILYIRTEDYGPKPKVGKPLVMDAGTDHKRTFDIMKCEEECGVFRMTEDETMSNVRYNAGTMTIEVDGLDDVSAVLGDLRKKTPAVAKVAINATARQARKLMIAEAKARYAVNSAGKRHLSDLVQRKKASNSSLSAELRIASYRNDLGYFQTRPNRPFMGHDVAQAPEYFTARVLKTSPMKALTGKGRLSKGFLVEFKSGHVGMVQRIVGTGRFHYTVRSGAPSTSDKMQTMGSPSAAAMHSTIWPEVEPEVELFLAAKLTERAEQVLARAKRKA